MGENEICSWHDPKNALNVANHGYDFSDLAEIFDGRFVVTREDTRHAYSETRYNVLAEFRGRIINVTLTPRGEKWHLISARPASRVERRVFHDRKANP